MKLTSLLFTVTASTSMANPDGWETCGGLEPALNRTACPTVRALILPLILLLCVVVSRCRTSIPLVTPRADLNLVHFLSFVFPPQNDEFCRFYLGHCYLLYAEMGAR